MKCVIERRMLLDLSAASAVVSVDELMYVVADDGTELVGVDREGVRLRSIPLGIDALSEEPKARKARKPDFEAIVDLGQGSVGVFGSGSTGERHRGRVVATRAASVTEVDLRELHLALADSLPELNLEGAVVLGESMLLAQRGNGPSRSNAIAVLDLASMRAELDAGVTTATSLREIVPVDLGELDGVALSFTDLAVDTSGRLWFSAAAEDTSSTYDDGLCVGSVIGRLDPSFRVVEVARVDGRDKVEGLVFDPADATGTTLFLVVDPDDPSRRATCMVARLLPA